MGSQIIALSGDRPEAAWAVRMARAVQASLVGYFVGGAFLNLAYWDMPYYLMVMLAVTRHALATEAAAARSAVSGESAAVAYSTPDSAARGLGPSG
jgi:hypothetical protein